MPSKLICVAELDLIDETFRDVANEIFAELIHRVPRNEEEAEWIISIVERMLSENPSLTHYLELDQEEYQKFLKDLRLLKLTA